MRIFKLYHYGVFGFHTYRFSFCRTVNYNISPLKKVQFSIGALKFEFNYLERRNIVFHWQQKEHLILL